MALAERYILSVKDAIVQASGLIGIEVLKAKQEEAISSFLASNDTFVSLTNRIRQVHHLRNFASTLRSIAGSATIFGISVMIRLSPSRQFIF